MHFRIQIIAVSDSGVEQCQEVADVVRSEALALATLGLTLLESKALLHSVQEVVAGHQVAAALEQHRPCPQCGKRRQLKDNLPAVFRTAFGELSLPNPRWRHCKCQSGQEPEKEARTFRPLSAILPERTTPELLYLESKWASLFSYGLTTKLLHDVLPIDEKHSQATVRNHLLRVAERSEKEMGDERPVFIEGCQAERDRLPIPDGPLSVGLDGGIVRARRKKQAANKSDLSVQSTKKKSTQTDQTAPAAKISKTANLFEVIAGKSILSFRRDDPEEVSPSSKCFAMVHIFDKKPKRRLFDLLQSQGMQANQDVTFFSDGGDNVRRIPEFLNPDSEHILDWFHITMRLTVLNQCARGLPKPKQSKDPSADTVDKTSLERCLESVKHYLWHGNTGMALTRLADVEATLENWGSDASDASSATEVNEDAGMPFDTSDTGAIDPELAPLPPLPQLPRSARFDGDNCDSASRMLRYVRELDTYIDNNARFIVNYGERYRSGERISTGFVESTINQVVSKRMVKKQQMQWTPKGAHLLLQVRTQVLNEDWEGTFRKWYPGFRPENSATAGISTPALAA